MQFANFEANVSTPRHYCNPIGYRGNSAGISASNGRSGDISEGETIDMPHLQRNAAWAVAATAQVGFILCGWRLLCKEKMLWLRGWSVQSCVRPLIAASILAAGLDGFRKPVPNRRREPVSSGQSTGFQVFG